MGLLSFAGDVVGGLLGIGAQSSANKANKELAEYQYEKNLEMWNRQNEYNSPARQMERLKAAGLNPNLVYGNGAVGNASSAPPQYDRPTINPVSNGGFVSDAVQHGIFTSAQLDNLKQQTELSKTQQKVQDAQIAKYGQEVSESIARTARSKFDLQLAEELKQNSVEMANENLRRIRTSNAGQEIMNDYNKARTMLIPLQKKLTENQIEQVATAVAQAKWDYQNELAGRIPKGVSLRDWFFNQLIRANAGQSNVLDIMRKNGSSVESLWDLIKGLF